MTIRVLLVEDNAAVRGALRAVLAKNAGVVVTGEAVNALTAIEQANLLLPDVIVLDVHVPDFSGMEVAERLHRGGSIAKIVALSAYSDRRFVAAMLKSGAHGYVTKSCAGGELVNAIGAVAGGQRYLCSEIAANFAAASPLRSKMDFASKQP